MIVCWDGLDVGLVLGLGLGVGVGGGRGALTALGLGVKLKGMTSSGAERGIRVMISPFPRRNWSPWGHIGFFPRLMA
jgi:hypothetical protein